MGYRRRSRPSGLEGGAGLTAAWRSVIGAGFALPRDAGRRPALLSRAVRVGGVPSSVAPFGIRGWCGTYGGVAQGHRCWFRAPARCRSETGAPVAAVRVGGVPSSVAPFGIRGWCGTYGGMAQRHWRWFRAPARCRSETGAPVRPASRGSAKPAPMTLRHAAVSPAPPSNPGGRDPGAPVSRPPGLEGGAGLTAASPPSNPGGRDPGAPVSDRHRAGARNQRR